MAETLIPHPSVHLETRRLELIRGYRVHETRTPGRPVHILTPSQTIGPFFPRHLLDEGKLDLACTVPGGARAEGTPIIVVGQVTDEQENRVQGALLEIWQANTWGKYDHPVDITPEPLDPNFKGYGRLLTDAEGCFRFRSIKPGAYPNPGYDDWYRPPHIHFSIFGAGLMQRLITQMYFPNEALNDIDPILNAIEDLDARASLIARELPKTQTGEPAYEFNIVLRGSGETPFFVDP